MQKRLIEIIISAVVMILAPAFAFAANIGVLPVTASVVSGNQVIAEIYVSSPDREINAVSGVLNFPSDKLEVVSISKEGSIFGMWVKDPEFSNNAGRVNFEGIILNPGFEGKSGTVCKVIFKAKAVGIAALNFSSVSVLANDGKGSNVFSASVGANYSITNAPAVTAPSVPQVKPVETDTILAKPTFAQVSSQTHPEQDHWYQDNNPVFEWKNSGSVVAIRLSADREPVVAAAEISYVPPISQKKIEGLEDGTWYFHLQQKKREGWGLVFNYRVNIDSVPPHSFSVMSGSGPSTTNPRPLLFFESYDDLSGVDFYEVKIDGAQPAKTASSQFKTDYLASGRHSVLVRAFDKAGNFTDATTSIEVVPVKQPQVIDYRADIDEGLPLFLKGLSPANVLVNIFVQDQEGNITASQVKSDQAGVWTFSGYPLEAGAYWVWANNSDGSGGVSPDTEKMTVTVQKPSIIRYGRVVVDYLSVVVSLLALIAVLVIGMVWLVRKSKGKKAKVGKEISEAQKASLEAFALLKKEVENQLAKTDGKPGTNEREREAADKLKKALDVSEKIVAREIGDVKNESEK